MSADFAGGLFRGVQIDVRAHHKAPAPGEFQCERFADAAAGASDDCTGIFSQRIFEHEDFRSFDVSVTLPGLVPPERDKTSAE